MAETTESYIRNVLSVANAVTDTQPEDWEPIIHMIANVGDTPMAGILSAMGSKPTTSQDLHWWQQTRAEQTSAILAVEDSPGNTYTTGAVAGSTIWLKMSNADADQHVTNQQLLLTDNATLSEFSAFVIRQEIRGATDSYVIVRMVTADNGANDLADIDESWIVGNAQAEGADMPQATMPQPVECENKTQILAISMALTNSKLTEQERLSPDVRSRTRIEALERYMMELEKAILFGELTDETSSAGRLRTMQGIISAIREFTSNDFNFATDTDTEFTSTNWIDTGYAWLNKQFEILFRKTEERQKMAFIGTEALSSIQRLVENTATAWNLETNASIFGIKVSTLVTVYGNIRLLQHPLFSDTAARRKSMLVTEMSLLRLRTFRPLKFLPDVFEGKFGKDRIDEGWRSETSLQFNNLDTFGWFNQLGDNNTV